MPRMHVEEAIKRSYRLNLDAQAAKQVPHRRPESARRVEFGFHVGLDLPDSPRAHSELGSDRSPALRNSRHDPLTQHQRLPLIQLREEIVDLVHRVSTVGVGQVVWRQSRDPGGNFLNRGRRFIVDLDGDEWSAVLASDPVATLRAERDRRAAP